MPVTATYKGISYHSSAESHAEEKVINVVEYMNKPSQATINKDKKDAARGRKVPEREKPIINIEINGWPCSDLGHECHALLKRHSAYCTFQVRVTDDHGGYAVGHPNRVGKARTGRITYADGKVTYLAA